jgi:hypothetical protein
VAAEPTGNVKKANRAGLNALDPSFAPLEEELILRTPVQRQEYVMRSFKILAAALLVGSSGAALAQETQPQRSTNGIGKEVSVQARAQRDARNPQFGAEVRARAQQQAAANRARNGDADEVEDVEDGDNVTGTSRGIGTQVRTMAQDENRTGGIGRDVRAMTPSAAARERAREAGAAGRAQGQAARHNAASARGNAATARQNASTARQNAAAARSDAAQARSQASAARDQARQAAAQARQVRQTVRATRRGRGG